MPGLDPIILALTESRAEGPSDIMLEEEITFNLITPRWLHIVAAFHRQELAQPPAPGSLIPGLFQGLQRGPTPTPHHDMPGKQIPETLPLLLVWSTWHRSIPDFKFDRNRPMSEVTRYQDVFFWLFYLPFMFKDIFLA